MLPTTSPLPARLAELLPSSLARVLESGQSQVFAVVDGLGSGNFDARRAHAPVLRGLARTDTSTVLPSTTGAALTSLLTGSLPGRHGITGYKILHPTAGIVSPLGEWPADEAGAAPWQRQTPVLARAAEAGAPAFMVANPRFAGSDFTARVVGAPPAGYEGEGTLEGRVAATLRLLRAHPGCLVYLYFDEVDKAGHKHGWQGPEWLVALEQLDAALGTLLTGLPAGTGFTLTADHGMIDVPDTDHIALDHPGLLPEGWLVGGETRCRYLYAPAELTGQARVDAATALLERLTTELGEFATAVPRQALLQSGWMGDPGQIAPEVAARVGDVVLFAKDTFALDLPRTEPWTLSLRGQHGSLTEMETTVPVFTI